MEQFDHKTRIGDSPEPVVGEVAFDVLRTIIAGRQAASPTARALTAGTHEGGAGAANGASESLITMFARGGTTSVGGSFVSDEAVIRQDERHA